MAKRLQAESVATTLDPQPPSVSMREQLDREWVAAGTAYARGDRQPMIDLLRQERLPVELCDLHDLAVSEARRLEAEIAADPGLVDALEAQFELLRRCRPATAEDAERIAQRTLELEREIARNRSKHSIAENGRHTLATLKRVFRELFSDETPPAAPWGACLPSCILESMKRFPYGPNPQHWREFAPVEPRPRRKVRAAGVFSAPRM